MSWFSELLHGHFNNPLGYGLEAAAGVGAAVFAPELLAGAGSLFGAGEAAVGAGAGLGALEEVGGTALTLGGEGAAAGGGLGLDALALGPEVGGNALGFAPEALSPTAGMFPENVPEGFFNAAAGTPNSFYDAIPGSEMGVGGATAQAPSNAALDFLSPAHGADIPFDVAGAGPPGGPTPMQAGAPFADQAPFYGDPTRGAGTGGSFWDKVTGGAMNSITKNPLGTALAAGGLGYALLGQRTSPEMKAMGAQARQLGAQGQQLMSYLQSGTLPPGLQQAVTNATSAAKASAIANAAKNGLSTDPTQNTPLAQQLASIDNYAVQLIAQEGEKLMNAGLSETQMSTQLFGMLEALNRQQSASIGRAIASFASAFGGGGTKIQIGGTA